MGLMAPEPPAHASLLRFVQATGEKGQRLGGLGLFGPDARAVRNLTEQDATDEGSALFAREPRLVGPGAIGERLVVQEVLRLLGVRQRLPLRRLLLRPLRR